MDTKENRTAGILITLSGGACWGLSGCFGQYLFQEKGITAEWLVTIRLTCAGLLLILLGLILTKRRMGDVWKQKADRNLLLLFAFAGMLTCQYTYFAAIQHSNAGTATVLQSLGPVVILTYICLRGKRLPTKLEAGAIFFALLGVFLLSTHGDLSSMNISSLALFFGLSSAVSVAVYNMMSGGLLRRYGVYAIVGYAMLLAGIAMLLVVRPWRYDVVLDKRTVLATAGVVIVGTAIAFSLYLKGVSIVGPFMGSLLGMVEPVTAIIISLAFLGADFHIMDFIGFVMILGTVVALSLSKKE